MKKILFCVLMLSTLFTSCYEEENRLSKKTFEGHEYVIVEYGEKGSFKYSLGLTHNPVSCDSCKRHLK